MRYERLEQVRAYADITEVRPPMTRQQRLKRWADVLKREGARPLEALRWVEFYAEPERRQLRRERSPIAFAFADPVLRAEGLTGDTLGDAQLFFELSDDEAHRLLCDCHFQGRMTGRSAARRIRALA
ncbi:MAG TPA: hypothetical protein VJS38_06955, partial [Phenylobacterium sp.]|uniref:hypothetical protein n=1 Tax=Phenylobacterium sp. TaxID=1871053 RepID=UPI002B495FC8